MTSPVSYIPAVRRLANEPTAAVFSDSDIMDLAAAVTEDGVVNVNALVAAIWRIKAARFSELVDVSEAGSSRKFSDLHKNALAMAATYDKRAVETEVGVALGVRPTTRAIVRPTE